MENFIKEKKNLLFGSMEYIKKIPLGWAWLIVVVVVATVFFYWFGVRPGQIRKECYNPKSDYYYTLCLQRHGLK